MKEIKFTPKEQLIYNHIKQVAKEEKKRTVAEIASEIGAAPSSIVKLAKKLGYSGWNEMYYSLKNVLTDEYPVMIDNFMPQEDEQLRKNIQKIAKIIMEYNDKDIMVVSIGDSHYLGRYLVRKLLERNYKAHIYEHVIRKDDRDGLCIAINESGVALLNVCIQMQEKNYKVIAVTSHKESPLASQSDYSVEMRNHKSELLKYEPNYFAARVLIFLEMLLVEMDEMSK